MSTKELYHYGVKGQKWGIRRYQNPDGSLTAEGKQHYKKDTVFVSGASKTTDPNSPYYRKELHQKVREKLNEYMNAKVKFVVGDAPGIDSQVQDYLRDSKYKNVIVFGPEKIRYLSNPDWKTKPIKSNEYEPMSKEWLAKKDIAMTKAATKGLAIIIENGGSSATRRNIERLINSNKDVKVFELSNENGDRWIDYPKGGK